MNSNHKTNAGMLQMREDAAAGVPPSNMLKNYQIFVGSTSNTFALWMGLVSTFNFAFTEIRFVEHWCGLDTPQKPNLSDDLLNARLQPMIDAWLNLNGNSVLDDSSPNCDPG
jgi:hypothetical protein